MEARKRWYEEAARRRGLRTSAARTPIPQKRPLAPQLLKGGAGRADAVAAARSLIETIAERSVLLTLKHETSHARLDKGVVNLDGRILRAPGSRLTTAERLLGVGAHEAGHFLLTEMDTIPRDPLFRVIQNILEDERIEAEVARRYPCTVVPMHAARRDLLTPAGEDDGFLAAVFTLVRCEAPIPDALWERYESRLRAVLDELQPFPRTPAEVQRAAMHVALRIPPEERESIPEDSRFDWFGGMELDGDEEDALSGIRVRILRSGLKGRRPKNQSPEGGEWPAVTWQEAGDASDAYAACASALGGKPAALANRLRAILPPEPVSRQRSGRIDRRRLHTYRYSDRLFQRKLDRESALSVALILDLSGSMMGSSAAIAKQVAVLLSEAVVRLPDARLDVFGHSADLGGSASTWITRFPNDATGRPLGLGDLPIDGNNRDAHAFEVIGDHLLESPARSSRHRLAVIIADGAPSASGFRGDPARDLTRDAILDLERRWGPVLFIATDAIDELRSMVPGASYRFRSDGPVDELARHLTVAFRRAPRRR